MQNLCPHPWSTESESEGGALPSVMNNPLFAPQLEDSVASMHDLVSLS